MTFPVEIGSKSMIKGFEEGLIGLKKGDEEKILESQIFLKITERKSLLQKPVSFDTDS